MQEQKQQLLTRLKESTNVLVTVSNNPTVDQLAAAIGFTLALDKLKKHATAVFSGEVPSVIEFLEPDKTIRKNTDSLRDFIISLDRDKADKLRYKVEDKVVKVFISPYRTAIKQEDLIFSQGDFNIDVVVAIGVKEQEDLDGAITAHGRILHDATVATVNTVDNQAVGSIHWINQQASSLSEMITELATELNKDALDGQIATALLTGIVAETDRFSNEKTKPNTLAISSKLMSAGANQQLVSSKLEEAKQPPEPEQPPAAEVEVSASEAPAEEADATEAVAQDGTLKIEHETPKEPELDVADIFNQSEDKDEDKDDHPIHIDEHGSLYNGGPPVENSLNEANPGASEELPKIIKKPSNEMLTEPPKHQGGALEPSTTGDDQDSFKDPLSDPDAARRNQHILTRKSVDDNNDATEPEASQQPASTPSQQEQSPSTSSASPADEAVTAKDAPESTNTEQPLQQGPQTLSDIEQSVGAHQQQDSPSSDSEQHQPAQPAPTTDAAAQATDATPQQQSPAELDQARQAIIDAVDSDKSNTNTTNEQPLDPIEALNAQPVDLNIHPEDTASSAEDTSQQPQEPKVDNPNQPPSVPPPMMPPSQ